MKTIAYIDGANLHQGVKNLGWRLDYARFRIWLKDKYKVGSLSFYRFNSKKQKSIYYFSGNRVYFSLQGSYV
jgi:hypothetical protein